MRPSRDRVLVKRLETQEQKIGGIIILFATGLPVRHYGYGTVNWFRRGGATKFSVPGWVNTACQV